VLEASASKASQATPQFPVSESVRYEWAEQHADCAGAYSVLYQWAKQREGQRADANSLQKSFYSSLEAHIKFAYILYGNKTKAEKRVHTARDEFISALKKGTSVESKTTECIRLSAKTASTILQSASK